MTIEIVDFPIKNGGSFHSYVSLPEGIPMTDPAGAGIYAKIKGVY